MKSKMYSQYAEQYDAAAQNNIYNAHLERPSLIAMLGDLNGLDVIDLGCGSGIYAEYLISQGVKNLTCIDLSDEMIDIVRAKIGNRAHLYTQDLSLGLPSEKSATADVIICPLVLHYIEDLSIIFKEVFRVLKPNGYMVFSTHHPIVDFKSTLSGNYFEREKITQQWNTIGEPVSVSFYRRSLTELTDAITNNGLVISQLSEGQIQLQAKTISAKRFAYLSHNPNFIFIKCAKQSHTP